MKNMILQADPKVKGLIHFPYLGLDRYVVNIPKTDQWCISSDPDGAECWLEYDGRCWRKRPSGLDPLKWDKVRGYTHHDLQETLALQFDIEMDWHPLSRLLKIAKLDPKERGSIL